jgi:Papain-like cysteine protease AvrRpt2
MAEPHHVPYRPPKRRPYRPDPVRERWYVRLVALISVLVLLAGALGTWAVATNTFGAGDRFESVVDRVDRFIAGPVPDRPAPSTILYTEPPASPTPVPTPEPSGSLEPDATASPVPTPTPAPVREAVDVDIVDDPDSVFNSQVDKDWCAPAGVQMVLAQLGLVGTTDGEQREIARRVREWESVSDSRNGNWGPAAMALALDAYGAPGYEIRAFDGRKAALRNAAKSIVETGAPVILLTWRGAHTWVMTGFKADADPTLFDDAQVSGAYILDPWYPRVSSIWGKSDGPGVFQDEDEMIRNFLPWKRPEGRYPDRDGLFIIVAPTIAVP